MASVGTVIRSALATIARGFLLGAGFSLALFVTYLYLWQPAIQKMNKEMADAMSEDTFGKPESIKDLTFSGVTELKHDGVTAIVGSVRNAGKESVHSATIEAHLFNKGKFVDKYSTSLSGPLAPGESQYFKISCGCDDTPPAEHDSYKVQVTRSY